MGAVEGGTSRSTALPATHLHSHVQLSIFLEGPEASKELPSTSTDMVKMGRH